MKFAGLAGLTAVEGAFRGVSANSAVGFLNHVWSDGIQAPRLQLR